MQFYPKLLQLIFYFIFHFSGLKSTLNLGYPHFMIEFKFFIPFLPLFLINHSNNSLWLLI